MTLVLSDLASRASVDPIPCDYGARKERFLFNRNCLTGYHKSSTAQPTKTQLHLATLSSKTRPSLADTHTMMAARQLVRADRQICQKRGEDTQFEMTESGLKVNLHRRGMKAMSKKNAPIVIRSFIVPESSLKKV